MRRVFENGTRAIDTGSPVSPAIRRCDMGDPRSDAVAGRFEGGVPARLRQRGIADAREPVTSSPGKMSSRVFGDSPALTCAPAVGIRPVFG